MHRSLKIALAVAFVFIAVYIISEDTDDSAAVTPTDKITNYAVTNAQGMNVYYDLFRDTEKTYGKEYVAFVSSSNKGYNKPILQMESRITYNGQTYEVVGIRNNAFKANETGSQTIAIEKVIIPETIQVIGATPDYVPDRSGNSGYVFGNCTNLKEVVIEGTNPRLTTISPGAFANTRIEVMDLSQCHDLTDILMEAFKEMPSLKLIDISGVKNVGRDAFLNSKIESFIMPTSATIDPSAFRGSVIKDFNGDVIYDYSNPSLRNTSALCGRTFSLVGGECKEGYIATFETNSAKTMYKHVVAPGDPIPSPDNIRNSETSTFWKWVLTDTSADATVMPGHDQSFTALWKAIVHDPVDKTYNGGPQQQYVNTDAYTIVSGADAKWVGTHQTTLGLTAGTYWNDGTTGTKDIAWDIVPKPVKISGILANDKVYDGNTTATLDCTHAVFTTLANGDTLTVTATGVFTDANAGFNKTVNISGFVLGGELAEQYEVAVDGNQTSALAKINKKIITVVVHDNSKTYGDADPNPISTWEWENGIEPIPGDVDGVTLTRVAGEDWGPKWINFEVVWSSTGNPENYTVKGDPGEFTIERKHIRIIAVDTYKEYGEPDPAPGSYTYNMRDLNGTLVNIPISFTVTITRAAGEAVGSYALTPTGEADEGNYVFTYVPGTFYITKAGVNILGPTKYIVYGEPCPTYTYLDLEFIGIAPFGEGITITCAYDPATGGVGEYDIVVTGPDEKESHVINYINGKLYVTYKPIRVIADSKIKTYGDADPELTFTVKDHDTGETLDIKNLLNVTLTRAAGEDYGRYRITPVGATTQGNYEIKYDFGAFDIERKTLNVYPDEIKKIYGEADPALTATIKEGLVGSDTIVYMLSRIPGEDVNVYDIISIGDIEQGNYIVKFHTGDFIIEYRTATVDVDDLYKVYTDPDPELTATVTGLLDGDSIEYTLTRAAGEDLGTYEVTASGEAYQGNYHVIYVPGSLTIEIGIYDVTINIVGKGTVVSDTYRCTPGTPVNLTVTPAPGWEVKTIVSEQVTIDDNSFTMGHDDVVVTVTFEKISEPTVVLSPVIAIAALAGILMLGFIVRKH